MANLNKTVLHQAIGAVGTATGQKRGQGPTEWDGPDFTQDHVFAQEQPITDPGNGGAIAVTASGFCPLVTAGAETRTLAAPTFIGQVILIYCKTFVGNAVVTCATTVNEAGNTIITFSATGQSFRAVAVEEGATLRWRLAQVDGAALS